MADKDKILAEEWNDSLKGTFLWSNVNFGEAVTQAMTPLAWSVLQFTLDDWVFIPGFSTVGNIGGFPYLNISIFASLFHGMGRSRQDLLNSMEATLYMRLPEEMEIPLIPLSPWKLFSSLFSSLRVQSKQKRGITRLPSYIKENPAWFQRIRGRIQAEQNRASLHALWHSEIKAHIKQGVWCVLGSATYAANYSLQLRRALEKMVGPEDANRLIANLSDDSDALASLGPIIGLAEVANGQMSRGAYLEQYGHRGPHEFEISLPRPAEDPRWLDQELAHYKNSPMNVSKLMNRQREGFEAAWGRLQSQYPSKASFIHKRIAKSAQQGRMRELARSEYVRDRWAIRLFALRAGELTGLGEEIFLLTFDETLNLLAGDQSVIGSIPARQEAYLRYRALPPYPSIILGRFDIFAWAANPQRRSDIYDGQTAPRPAPPPDNKGKIILGSPGSAGQVEGVVRRLDNPQDGGQFQAGEILVAVQTDIAWTPLFPRAAAVITDIGAPLSHAAIVARELGIPAVVGCGDATMRLKTGDRVRVDGGGGTVEIL
jgi:pyruvate,water dikinase